MRQNENEALAIQFIIPSLSSFFDLLALPEEGMS
jgi:hypothetical protein